jgi:hypothetical protein
MGASAVKWSRRLSDISGSMSMLLAGAIAALCAVSAFVGQVWGIADARWRTEAAADMSAIAVAMTGDCGSAAATAAHNSVVLDSCSEPSSTDHDAVVSTRTSVQLLALKVPHMPVLGVSAKARAGL